ncbi:hypothetical protein H4Q26_014334 [Puccinia striiformis f. sp. tritici PST-130]|nr:hypothetical protein H4Q26_014334 [Puccinia striiformis f. sp. tritici PST-130]
MHFNSVLFLSLMATLGNVAAVDWDCDLGRHEKYCGAKVQSSGTSTCYLFHVMAPKSTENVIHFTRTISAATNPRWNSLVDLKSQLFIFGARTWELIGFDNPTSISCAIFSSAMTGSLATSLISSAVALSEHKYGGSMALHHPRVPQEL